MAAWSDNRDRDYTAEVHVTKPADSIGAPLANGLNVTVIFHKGQAGNSSREFRMEGPGHWTERTETAAILHHFDEVRRETDSVFLSNKQSHGYLWIDLKGKTVKFSTTLGPWPANGLFTITSAFATSTELTEKRCIDTVQGHVAWNKQGDKSWPDKEVRQLCKDTTLIDRAIECFSRELKSHGDGDKAVKTCTADRHRVQMVYVIPKGEHPKADAEKALVATMANVQRHYFEQFGVTFKLSDPPVKVVHIDEPIKDLIQPPNSAARPMTARTAKLVENELHDDYVFKENLIVTIYEGPPTSHSATGGGNQVVLPPWTWIPTYKMFETDPSRLHEVAVVHGWSHELGHAFGLSHSEDSRRCFKAHHVDLGHLPSLVMQLTMPQPSLFDFPFIHVEKRLLLDETYYPDCRPALGARPHASKFLRHPLPAPAAPVAPQDVVNGQNVTVVRIPTGEYRMVDDKQWTKWHDDGAISDFTETVRNMWSVHLKDKFTDEMFQLDLFRKGVFDPKAHKATDKPLQPITGASKEVDGHIVRMVRLANGNVFHRIGGNKWEERHINGKKTQFTEIGRDKWSVDLEHGPMHLRLDVFKQKVLRIEPESRVEHSAAFE